MFLLSHFMKQVYANLHMHLTSVSLLSLELVCESNIFPKDISFPKAI